MTTSTASAQTSAHSGANWQALYNLLLSDRQTTQALIDALEKERHLLTTRDYDGLTAALAEKSLLVQQLEQRSNERQQFLQDAGFESEKDLLSAADREQPAVATAWRELASLWENCQSQNQINDQIVRRTRLVIQRIMEIMHGQPDLGRTYNPKGESYKGYSSKAIASA